MIETIETKLGKLNGHANFISAPLNISSNYPTKGIDEIYVQIVSQGVIDENSHEKDGLIELIWLNKNAHFAGLNHAHEITKRVYLADGKHGNNKEPSNAEVVAIMLNKKDLNTTNITDTYAKNLIMSINDGCIVNFLLKGKKERLSIGLYDNSKALKNLLVNDTTKIFRLPLIENLKEKKYKSNVFYCKKDLEEFHDESRYVSITINPATSHFDYR